MTTRLTASHVIGFDGTDHIILRDAEVVWEGSRIVFVGRGFDGRADRTIDAGKAIISPGFIDLDALADIDHALLDCWHGPATEGGLNWSEDYFRNGRRNVFSPEDMAFKHEFAIVQLIRNGITTMMPIEAETHNEWAETYDEFATMAETAARFGIRAYLGPSYRSGVNVVRADGRRDVLRDEPRGEAGLLDAVRYVRDFDGAHGELIRGCLLPCRIETLTPALMRATARAAEELGCRVRLHCLQDKSEIEMLRAWYGKSPLDLLDETGLLKPFLLIPHAVLIGGNSRSGEPDRGDIERIARSGASIVHCPMTSIRYGSALESFDRYRQAGINIALGTDSFPPDMIRNMDYGSNIAKFIDGRRNAGSAADYFRAVTLGGAKALGQADLGRLAPGAKADIAVVDLSDPRVGPIDDTIRTLLMNCTGANVVTVVIDGRVVMEDRRLPSVDEAAMARRAQAYFDTMKAAYSERDYCRRPANQLFPPSFRTAN